MNGLIINIHYFRTLYMIKSPVFVFAITQHLTIRSQARTNYSEVYARKAKVSPYKNIAMCYFSVVSKPWWKRFCSSCWPTSVQHPYRVITKGTVSISSIKDPLTYLASLKYLYLKSSCLDDLLSCFMTPFRDIQIRGVTLLLANTFIPYRSPTTQNLSNLDVSIFKVTQGQIQPCHSIPHVWFPINV